LAASEGTHPDKSTLFKSKHIPATSLFNPALLLLPSSVLITPSWPSRAEAEICRHDQCVAKAAILACDDLEDHGIDQAAACDLKLIVDPRNITVVSTKDAAQERNTSEEE
jgi:hypothetical protein